MLTALQGRRPWAGGKHVSVPKQASAGRVQASRLQVIYYLKRVYGVIWMLTMYPKNVIEDIPAHVLRQIREEIENA